MKRPFVAAVVSASLLAVSPASAGRNWQTWKQFVNHTSQLKDIYRLKENQILPGLTTHIKKWLLGITTIASTGLTFETFMPPTLLDSVSSNLPHEVQTAIWTGVAVASGIGAVKSSRAIRKAESEALHSTLENAVDEVELYPSTIAEEIKGHQHLLNREPATP